MEAIKRIANRLGVDEDEVRVLAKEFDLATTVAILNYLDSRVETMVGDENPTFELQQIRRDLGSMAMMEITEKADETS